MRRWLLVALACALLILDARGGCGIPECPAQRIMFDRMKELKRMAQGSEFIYRCRSARPSAASATSPRASLRAERMDGYIDRLLRRDAAAPAWAASAWRALAAPRRYRSIWAEERLRCWTPGRSRRSVRRAARAVRGGAGRRDHGRVCARSARGRNAGSDAASRASTALSFGVQSFVDAECAAVGRTHTAAQCRPSSADAGRRREAARRST